MHEKISSRLAIGIIAVLTALFGGCILIKSGIFEQNNDLYINNAPIAKVGKIEEADSANKENLCKTHSYRGEVEISGWYSDSEDGWLLVVSDDDIEKLPRFDGTEEYKEKNKKIKLVDATSQIEKKIKTTSEEKPVKVKITGFVARCDDVPLASLEYKDGIFKKYLSM